MSTYSWDVVIEGNITHIGDSEHPDPVSALDAALDWVDASPDISREKWPEASHVAVVVADWVEPTDQMDDRPTWYWFGSPILCGSDSSIESIPL
jgi:hypothetical protein